MRLHTISIVTHGELKVLAERNEWGAEKGRVLAVALDNFVTVNIESKVRRFRPSRVCRPLPDFSVKSSERWSFRIRAPARERSALHPHKRPGSRRINRRRDLRHMAPNDAPVVRGK
jgi:hypothetical protein